MSHSLIRVRPRSGQEIELISSNVIKSFQPEALIMVQRFDVERFFELELKNQTNLEPDFLDLPEGLEGYTDFEQMECVISSKLAEYNDEDMVKRRRLRATQAHEIGHCFLHVEDARRNRDNQRRFLHDENSSLKLYKPNEIELYENPEWQAWRFASSLLMPEICFRTAIQRNWTKVLMKRAFDVNPSFINVRLKELKVTKQIRNG